MDRYVITGGQAGYDRLQLLARTRWPDTRALLERAGVRAGMRCVDLGCGSGAVTIELARMTAPHGAVTGVDMDAIELALARDAAGASGVTNAEFRALDIQAWDEPAAYDVVFSRFLLQHLSQPVETVRRMWAAVRAGGSLIIEDADFSGWRCHPANDGFEFLARAYRETLSRRGGDGATGRKLYRYFLDAGIPEAQVTAVMPADVDGEGKTLALSTLIATAPAILAEGVASRDELDVALESLAAFTADPGALIAGPTIFQVWSRR